MNHSLIFLITLLSPTQLGKHFWPPSSFLQGLKIDYLAPTLYLTDLLLLLLFIFTFSTLINFITNHKKPSLLTLLFIIANIAFAHQPLTAMVFFLRALLLFNLFLALTRRPLKPSLYLAFYLTLILTSLLTYAQFFNQASLNGWFYFLGERRFTPATLSIAKIDLATTPPFSTICQTFSLNCPYLLRPYATFSHPNSLAGFILLVLSLLIVLNRHFSIKKTYLYLILIISLPALLLTFSRNAIFIAILTLPLFAGKHLPRLLKKTYLVSLTLIYIIVNLSFIFINQLSLLSSHSTWQDRLLLNKAAVTSFIKNPLIGVGANNFLYHLGKLHPNLHFTQLQPPHNIFWLFLSQFGLLLFIPLALYLFKLLKNLPLTQKIPLLIILFTGTFDHYWLTLPQNLLLLTLTISIFATLSSTQS